MGAAASAAIIDSVGDKADDLIWPTQAALTPGGILPKLLTATYVTDCSTVYMRASCPGTEDIPFTPQCVVNWIYQALGVTIETLQLLLGSNRFNGKGELVDDSQTPAQLGGQVVVFWGTEIGARRTHSLIGWDYDADVAAFYYA